jgi:hypothetical protein
VSNQVFTLYSDTVQDLLYASGWFDYAGGNYLPSAVKWNGSSWQLLGTPVQTLFAFHYHKDTLFATGAISNTIYEIGYWDGTDWVVTDTANVTVKGMLSLGDTLAAFGHFDSIQHVAAKGVAFKYNGQWQSTNFPFVWYNPPPYVSDPPLVNHLLFYNGDLYAGGTFEDTLGNPVNLARYDGISWQPVPGLSGGWGGIGTMAVYNGELYVGGGFTSPCKGIAKWNGSTWSDVGGSVTNSGLGDVFAMNVHNNNLYAAGQFSEIGGVNAPYLAQWDGSQWCNFVGNDLISTIGAIQFWRDTMYVLCANMITMQDTVGRIGKWMGDYIGDTCGAVGIKEVAVGTEINLYPNPAIDEINLEFELKESKNVTISVYNSIGQEMFSETEKGGSGLRTKRLNVSHLSSGMYIIQVRQGDWIANKRLIKNY